LAAGAGTGACARLGAATGKLITMERSAQDNAPLWMERRDRTTSF